MLTVFVYVVLKGTFAGPFAEGARDIDARYFFIAGRVWLRGHSPYDFPRYRREWQQFFGDAIFPGGFAYFPGAALYSTPMGAVGWATARMLFRAMNLGAVVAIGAFGVAFVRRHVAGPLELRHYAWIAFGMVIGGVPGTILTGQSTVIVTAACFVVAVGQLDRASTRFLALLALLAASSKPQIAGPLLLLVFLADRPARRSLVVCVVGVGLVSAGLLGLDPAPVADLLQAIRGNANLGVNGAGRMIGLGPLLEGFGLTSRLAKGLGKDLGWLALATVIACAARLAWRETASGSTATAGSRGVPPIALMAGFLSVGLAYPYHIYDTAMFAPVCGMAGLLSHRRQLLLFPALALVSRPRLVSWLWGRSDALENQIVSVMWLATLVAIVSWLLIDTAAGKVGARPRAQAT